MASWDENYISQFPCCLKVKVLIAQSCLTLCDPMDCIASVHGILQARILEWVTFPSPGDLPDPGIKPGSPTLQADSLPSEPPGKPGYRHLEPRCLQRPQQRKAQGWRKTAWRQWQPASVDHTTGSSHPSPCPSVWCCW
ncbi:hypothetical protein R6Z07F_012710 [Ovis aries]